MYIVYVTYPNMEEARETSVTMVESGLAGCANLIEGMESVYIWEGEVVKEKEVICLFKTNEKYIEELRNKLIEAHTYSVPCVMTLSPAQVNEGYLQWLNKNMDNNYVKRK